MRKINTVIIGGGISGLACGRTLCEADKDFVLLSPNIGGRMLMSKSGTVDYGASYITSDYKNVHKYIEQGSQIKISDCYFANETKFTTLFCWKSLLESPKLIKLWFTLKDFRKRLRKLRHRALTEQQKDILASDPVLSSYVNTSAVEYVRKNKLEWLNDTFFNPLFNSTGYMEYDKSNLFFYFDNLMSAACNTYTADYSNTISRITKGWTDKIKKTTVQKIKRKKNGDFSVKCSNGSYTTKNIVIAVPYNAAKKFHDIPKPKFINPIYVFHVVGKREEAYQNKKVVFFRPKHKDITILWKQSSGSDIIFSKLKNPKLEKYYEYYNIIKRTYWDTAVMLSGNKWTPQNLGKNLYLASDYNLCSLEDAFITGVYAANQIISTGF